MEPLPQDPLKVRIKTYEVIMQFLQYQLENSSLTDKFPIQVACECMENLQNLLNGKLAAAEAISPSSNFIPKFERPNQQLVLAEARLEAYDTISNFLKLYSSNLSSTCTETLEIAQNSMQAIQEIILSKNMNYCGISSSGKSSSDRLTANSPRSDRSDSIAGKRSNSLDSLLGISEMTFQQIQRAVMANQLQMDKFEPKFALLKVEDEPKARQVATLSPRKRSLSANDLNLIGELLCSPPKQQKKHSGRIAFEHSKQKDVLVEGNMKDNKLETVEELSHSLVNLQLKDKNNEKEKSVSQNTNKDDGPSTKPT